MAGWRMRPAQLLLYLLRFALGALWGMSSGTSSPGFETTWSCMHPASPFPPRQPAIVTAASFGATYAFVPIPPVHRGGAWRGICAKACRGKLWRRGLLRAAEVPKEKQQHGMGPVGAAGQGSWVLEPELGGLVGRGWQIAASRVLRSLETRRLSPEFEHGRVQLSPQLASLAGARGGGSGAQASSATSHGRPARVASLPATCVNRGKSSQASRALHGQMEPPA